MNGTLGGVTGLLRMKTLWKTRDRVSKTFRRAVGNC